MRLRSSMAMLALAALAGITPATARAQCCLSGLFSGLHSCCQPRAPVYAVAPIVAPPVAAVPAAPPPPPQPVMVPVQQVSYVPETCYRTEYQCVPQTCYRQICEIDPCTGCATPCMEPVTSYVQKPVNVPYTQYRAVTTTKYVQVQPGSPEYPAAAAAVAAPPAAASPFAAPTTPQAWAAAGADVPPTLTPQAQPTAPQQSFQQQFQQQIVPQSGSTPMSQTQPRPRADKSERRPIAEPDGQRGPLQLIHFAKDLRVLTERLDALSSRIQTVRSLCAGPLPTELEGPPACEDERPGGLYWEFTELLAACDRHIDEINSNLDLL